VNIRSLDAAFSALDRWAAAQHARLHDPASRMSRIVPTPRQALAVSLGAVTLLWLLWQRCGVMGCPAVEQLSAYQPGGGSILLDREGKQFANLTPVEYAVVEIGDLPKYVGHAFVAVEDKRFYQHNGIDYRRVLGSVVANVKAGGVAQGFSTITMQLARNVWRDRLPGAQRTLKRKILEIRVAREIERKFTKDEILELYLNHIYFGGGAYGIEAAARNYFGHSARRLTLSETATLAALPKSPRIYDPRRNPQRSKVRRNLILSMMAAQGRIDGAQAKSASAMRLVVRREPPAGRRKPPFAPYFVEAVRHELEDRLGQDLYKARLRIHTTLDRRAQEISEQELARQLRAIEVGEYGRFRGRRYSASIQPGDDLEYLQGAVVVMQVHTGDLLALVGGRDFQQSRFDRATRALRQPGSAFKPFVFAVALREGYAPSQHIADTPLRMDLPGGEVWEPRNFEGEFEGDVTLRQAIVRSKNVPTVRLAAAVGVPDVIRLARRAGIRSSIPVLPSIAIGTGNVTPLDLTAAYTTFAGMGESTRPRTVTRVEDADGNVLWANSVDAQRVLEPPVAYLLTNLLSQAVNEGTGVGVRRAGYTGPAAGKTGTTQDGADVWFVGYTPDVVGTIWMGFDSPKPILAEATGGRLAAPVWGRIMRRTTRNRAPTHEWIAPDEIQRASVDPSTGLVLVEGCRPEHGRAAREIFIAGSEPASACPRGTPEPGAPGFMARFVAWGESAFNRGRVWVASHFGREEPVPERQARDRYLGSPKLPTATDIAVPELPADSFPLLGEEIVIPDVPPINAETLGVYRPEPGDTVLVVTPSETGFVLQPAVVDDSGNALPEGRGRGNNPR
jgi:penicillin-binding protein 1A